MSTATSINEARKPPGLWLFFLLALVLLLVFWAGSAWLTSWAAGNAEPEEAARAELRIKNLAELRADNAKKLDSYAWIDRAKGSVQIPITEAMKLVVARINDSQPRAAYPVATPAPSATPAPPAP
jgi:hypothetical protein